ncbi:hypothetical protein S091751_2026 [Staphylococcus aureus subsp. aureus 091751]|nr:hypothetical protein S091751_2026 [Staphylococcus aureus subsp. aureus 091751]
MTPSMPYFSASSSPVFLSGIWEWDRNDIFPKFISSSHSNLHIIVS